MKKTLLSMTAALAVIGVANAGIKETCLEHPDKLVWVEKTQRCIPINPCKSDDENIQKAYCFPIDPYITFGTPHFPNEIDRDMVIDKYVQAVLKTSVIKKIDLGRTGSVDFDFGNNGYEENAIGVKTADGGYFAMLYSFKPYFGTAGLLAIAAEAYGRFSFGSNDGENTIEFSVSDMSEELCKDIISFASMLSGSEKISFKSYDSENYRCIVSRGI